MKKTEITSLINNDDVLKGILNIYKKNKKTTGERIDNISTINTGNNGLSDSIYVLKINDEIIDIIVPIFSTNKTITWEFKYLDVLKSIIPELSEIKDHEIVSKITCLLYYFDTTDDELLFLNYNTLNDWLSYGKNGKTGGSVYWWNDKLSNQYSINKKEIINNVFVKSLNFLTKKEIKTICKDYAEKFYARFNTENDTRTSKQTINNVSKGLYAEILIYLQLLKAGYSVAFNWSTKDDLGIDIKLKVNDEYINIDVKSTSDNYLKISRNRKETDFYAITIWNKSQPVLLGFLNKNYFWKSKIYKTDGPIKKDGMYIKSINSIADNIISIDDLYGQYIQYKKQKMKQNQRLFEIQ